jgi:hypothetical protein
MPEPGVSSRVIMFVRRPESSSRTPGERSALVHLLGRVITPRTSMPE